MSGDGYFFRRELVGPFFGLEFFNIEQEVGQCLGILSVGSVLRNIILGDKDLSGENGEHFEREILDSVKRLDSSGIGDSFGVVFDFDLKCVLDTDNKLIGIRGGVSSFKFYSSGGGIIEIGVFTFCYS